MPKDLADHHRAKSEVRPALRSTQVFYKSLYCDEHYLSCCTIFTENKILLSYLLFTCSSHHKKNSLKIAYWDQMWLYLRTKLSALNSTFCLVTCMLQKKYVLESISTTDICWLPLVFAILILKSHGTCRLCRKTKKPKTILLNSD